jgi:integrase
MKIYKRGGYYWMRFMFDGRRVERSTRQRNKREAGDYATKFRSRLIDEGIGFLQREAVPTFREFSERFTSEIALRCASKPRTVQFYGQQLERLLDFQPLADAKLNAIDESLISRFVQHRSQAVSPATVNRAMATLRRALRTAQEWRLIDRIPRFRLLKGERQREFVLTPRQELIYFPACPQPLHDVALLMLDTGLRLGEALSLCKADIHTQKVNGAEYGYLYVRDGKSKNARRAVPLTARVETMIQARLSTVQSVWVFPGDNAANHCAGSSLDHAHSKVRTALGLPDDFVLHSLRHSYLTRLGSAGADAFTIMRLAGHSSVTVSQRYVHPSQSNMESAVKRLEGHNANARKAALQQQQKESQALSAAASQEPPTSVAAD